MMVDFTTVTEVSGELISKEQLQRMCNRYLWAGDYIKHKDILEVACGAGQGLKYFSTLANRVVAGDICDTLVAKAKENVGNQVEVSLLNAESLHFPDHSFDIVILFEAIYYLERPEQFLRECKRVLKPNGQLLIATANKDLFDFNPSPYSYHYFGIPELKTLLDRHGFVSRFFGDTPIKNVSSIQKIARPIKKLAVQLNLMPRSMRGKQFLKKLIFGKPLCMPTMISENTLPYVKPNLLCDDKADKQHKVIFCEATLI